MTITLRSAKGQALTHNELDANFTTLQTADSDHAALTAAHGVTGDVVGTTDTQTLTNKTLTSPSIGSGVTVSSGNIVLSGTAQRLMIDGSSGTFANRFAIQDKTTNQQTFPMVLPNGTSQLSGIGFFNSSDPANAAYLSLSAQASQMVIASNAIGTGSYKPLNFQNGGATRMTLGTNGRLGLGAVPNAGWEATPTVIPASMDIGAAGAIWAGVADIGVTANAYYNGTSWVYKTDGAAFDLSMGSAILFRYASAGTAENTFTYSVGLTMNPSGQIYTQNIAPVSPATVTSIYTPGNLGNCYEWGHSNTAGYRSTLGANTGSGVPFIGFNCEAGSTANTFRTRGIPGTIITTDVSGNLTISSAMSANADNQALTGRWRLDASGAFGYATGVGGSVTQLTNKGTSVTLNKASGQITTAADSMGAGTNAQFVVNNSLVTATDVVVVNISNSANYVAQCRNVAAGSFAIRLTNITAGSLSEAVLINFAIIKCSTT